MNTKGSKIKGGHKDSGGSEQVIDFKEVRAQKLEEKRRTNERVFFKRLLSVYSVATKDQMFPVDLIEVSEQGCSFQVPFDPHKPWPNDMTQFPIRLYFSQDSFLEIYVQVQNSRPAIENHNRFLRLGCAVDRTATSYPAYQAFVRFLKQYAEHAQNDPGNTSIFYL